MQILGLLGIYFDAVEVEVKNFLLLFRLALTIITCTWKNFYHGITLENYSYKVLLLVNLKIEIEIYSWIVTFLIASKRKALVRISTLSSVSAVSGVYS